jgi:hypothetical protein
MENQEKFPKLKALSHIPPKAHPKIPSKKALPKNPGSHNIHPTYLETSPKAP